MHAHLYALQRKCISLPGPGSICSPRFRVYNEGLSEGCIVTKQRQPCNIYVNLFLQGLVGFERNGRCKKTAFPWG
jgi:hypothetical protein